MWVIHSSETFHHKPPKIIMGCECSFLWNADHKPKCKKTIQTSLLLHSQEWRMLALLTTLSHPSLQQEKLCWRASGFSCTYPTTEVTGGSGHTWSRRNPSEHQSRSSWMLHTSGSTQWYWGISGGLRQRSGVGGGHAFRNGNGVFPGGSQDPRHN